MKKRVAIIGAGIAGLALAQRLRHHAEPVVFEKARGAGGRMSTRYADPFYFDHGAQFFTARTAEFQHFLAPMLAQGLVAPWEGKVITIQEDRRIKDRLWFEPHYVAVPNMNSLCKHMANGISVYFGTEVAPLCARSADGWHLADKTGASLGVFDWVISTAPPVQTQRLFAAHAHHEPPPPTTPLLGCYTLMFGFKRSWNKPWIAAKIHASPIEWVAINSSKPGRDASVTCIVAHTSNAWAEAHIDDDMNQAELFLRREFEAVSAIDTTEAEYASCHRWRYALVANPAQHEPYVQAQLGIASTGDWCSASRVEDAWLNANHLADTLIRLWYDA